MRGKKALLARCFMASRLTPLVSRLRSLCVRDLPILAYHRIWDVTDEARFAYDVELISASVADFTWQMQHVAEHFTPITFATLGRILDGEVPCPPRPIVITFDDGFEDNYQHAFPILQAVGIPATIFVSTDYIGTNKTYWFDQLAHMLLTTDKSCLDLADLGQHWLLSDIPSRRVAIADLLDRLKRIPNAERLAVLAAVEIQLGGHFNESATSDSSPMNWRQVREMADAGIEFGSHTVSHPILANLTADDLRTELTESKRVLEEQIRQPVTTISYPVGYSFAFNDQVCSAVRDAGYRFATSYISGNNRLSSLDNVRLRRLHVERDTRRDYFAALLQLPEALA